MHFVKNCHRTALTFANLYTRKLSLFVGQPAGIIKSLLCSAAPQQHDIYSAQAVSVVQFDGIPDTVPLRFHGHTHGLTPASKTSMMQSVTI